MIKLSSHCSHCHAWRPSFPCHAGEDAIVLQGDFAWDLETGPSVSELDLKVPVGSLVTIVGQTGSGKSSVLAAALGLMNQTSGPSPEVHGKVSYPDHPTWERKVGAMVTLRLSGSLADSGAHPGLGNSL